MSTHFFVSDSIPLVLEPIKAVYKCWGVQHVEYNMATIESKTMRQCRKVFAAIELCIIVLVWTTYSIHNSSVQHWDTLWCSAYVCVYRRIPAHGFRYPHVRGARVGGVNLGVGGWIYFWASGSPVVRYTATMNVGNHCALCWYCVFLPPCFLVTDEIGTTHTLAHVRVPYSP